MWVDFRWVDYNAGGLRIQLGGLRRCQLGGLRFVGPVDLSVQWIIPKVSCGWILGGWIIVPVDLAWVGWRIEIVGPVDRDDVGSVD